MEKFSQNEKSSLRLRKYLHKEFQHFLFSPLCIIPHYSRYHEDFFLSNISLRVMYNGFIQ